MQENLIEQQPDSTENVSCETSGDLQFQFAAKYSDIFDGLDATDTADGSNKKTRKIFLAAAFLMCVQLVYFVYTKSGVALVFALLLGGMAAMLKKKSQKANVEIAQEFEKEGVQTIVVADEKIRLNTVEVSYDEIEKVYDLKRSFSIIYRGNHVYIIPKNALDADQTEQFISVMREKVGAKYLDMIKK